MREDIRDCVFDVDVDRFIENRARCSSSLENAGEDFLNEGGDIGVFVTVVFSGFFGMGIGFEVRFVCSDSGGNCSTSFVTENDEKGRMEMFGGIFDAGNCELISDIPRNSDDE